mmetsp:Transcript_61177/g.147320  ORF Transcript_61177/g.147320 Transcript_61177/m.147320 type:complete len:212 (+) Transcript_61177:573-1208(+)
MVVTRRAHVGVVAHAQPLVERLKHGHVLIAQLDGLDACGRGRVGNLLAVLIRAREEEDLPPVGAVVARDHVGADALVRVPHVRRPIRVVDRRRNVEALLLTTLGGRRPLATLGARGGSLGRGEVPDRVRGGRQRRGVRGAQLGRREPEAGEHLGGGLGRGALDELGSGLEREVAAHGAGERDGRIDVANQLEHRLHGAGALPHHGHRRPRR